MTILYNLFVLIEWSVIAATLFTFLNRFVEEKHAKAAMTIVFGNGTSEKKKGKSTKFPIGTEPNDSEATVTLFGSVVADPFVSLEDTTLETTKTWIQEQKEYSENYLSTIAATTKKIMEEIIKSQAFEIVDPPFHHGDHYFFFKKLKPKQQQFGLFSTRNLNVEAKLIFHSGILQSSIDADSDNGLGNNASQVFLNQQIMHGTWISDDGYKAAIGYSDCTTSTDMTIMVRDLKNSEDLLIDIIRHCHVECTSVSWLTSRIGFFYTTLHPYIGSVFDGENEVVDNTPKMVSRVMFHRLGVLQRDDLVVFEHISDVSNSQSLSTVITSDGHYIMIEIYKTKHTLSSNSSHRFVSTEHSSLVSAGNKVYYFDLTKFDGKIVKTLGSHFKLVDTFSYRFQYISNIEEDFWFRTNYKAPCFRVVRISLPEYHVNYTAPTAEYEYRLLMSWKTSLDWIPERVKDGGYLETAGIAAHTVLVLKYLINGVHEVLLYDLTSTLQEESQIPVADLPHPPYGTITGPNCNFYSSEIFYQYSDFSDPGSIYRAIIKRDICTGSIEISFDQLNSIVVPHIDKYEFETRQEFIKVSNGKLDLPILHRSASNTTNFNQNTNMNNIAAKIPILLFGSRLLFDNWEDHKTTSPCILYTYSGFGVCNTAKFSLPLLILAKHFKVMIAVVNVEGSGIYGAPFYSAGCKTNKQRSVDDLHNAINYLVNTKKYTTADKLGLYGGGNGGLLIGAELTAHPTSASCAVITDGLFDMVKYHQFDCRDQSLVKPIGTAPDTNTTQSASESSTSSPTQEGDSEALPYFADAPQTSTNAQRSAGPYWKDTQWYSEYGCVEENESEFNRLLSLSPLHRIRNMSTTTNSNSNSSSNTVSGGDQAAYPALMLNISNSNSHNSVSFKHTFKFLAEFQRVCGAIDGVERPLLLDFLDTDDVLLNPQCNTNTTATSTSTTATNESTKNTDVSTQCDHSEDSHSDVPYATVPIDKIASLFAFLITNIKASQEPDVVTLSSSEDAINAATEKIDSVNKKQK